jgi:diguanylate cyclase (GGDEF)-like protein
MRDSDPLPLRAHHSRLEALWELLLHEDTAPEKQLHALLAGAAEALGCQHVSLDHAQDGVLIAAEIDGGGSRIEHSLFSLARDRSEPTMIYNTAESRASSEHPTVLEVPLGSLLIWPFTGEPDYALVFGWSDAREEFISEEETRYVGFLTQTLSRIFVLAQKKQELSDRVVTDPLTGLYNRAGTLEHLALAVAGAERTETPIALCYIDLDGFKQINDTHGHGFGDRVLVEAARRMRAVLRKHEIPGRIGGDEFALVIPSFHNDAELAAIARRIQNAVSAPMENIGITASVKASIGIAIFPRDGKTPDELLVHADAAMYQAKRGGNGYAFYAPQPERVKSIFPVQLANADMEREFLLCYQPIVHARTGKAIAVEAFLRWHHPGMGLIAPRALLDQAQQQQCMPRVDRWVLGSAAATAAKLHKGDGRLVIHVNVSEADAAILPALDKDAERISIEVTEDAVAADPTRYKTFFAACRERGLSIGLSNFGFGGLSLGVLTQLPLDYVKLADFSSPGLIETAHHFGWMAIAQNVESEWQRKYLLAQGIDALQGYLISAPLMQSDLQSWLHYQSTNSPGLPE